MTVLCGKPMRHYQLNRYRDYDPAPACGRRPGHRGNCLTPETMRRKAEWIRRHRQARKETTP